jgi:AraC family transcriptional regulator
MIEYRKESLETKKFIGLGIDTTVQNAPQDCAKIWQEFMGQCQEITNAINPKVHYGLCVNPNNIECSFRYVASCEVPNHDLIHDGMERAELPAANYFVFIHKGKVENVGNTYMAIMGVMENNEDNKKQKEGFWFEYYDDRYKGNSDDSEYEIWIPVE